MANKYVALIAGKLKEVIATVVSAGAGDAGEIVALDAAGKLDVSVLPTGVGPSTISVVTSETLAAGDFVNIYDNVGVATARKADSNVAGKEAMGFVLAAVTTPAAASVYTSGSNNQVTGQTPGRVYLSETAGLSTATPPTAAGSIVQLLGYAISATNVVFQAEDGVTLA